MSLAGINGAGKSSIGGSALQAQGQYWYNPDEFVRRLNEQHPDKPVDEINSQVWHEGRRRRVDRGGHDILEALIRSRCRTSMQNLCRLAPGLSQLAVYDNSKPLDDSGHPDIRRLLHVVKGEIRELHQDMPDWAKPIAAVSLTQSNMR